MSIDRAASTPIPQTPTIEALENRTLFAATRILPLGDSITVGPSGHASYRYWLWKSLQAGGCTNIDFVGTQNNSPLYSDFDADNDGHSGFRADDIANNISSWAASTRPDIVLLHIGTNDFFQNQSVASTIADVGSIIDKLRGVNPNVAIVLAQITPDTQNPNEISQYDAQIPALAAQKNTSASKIVVVDQYSGFSAVTDTYDGTHPNESGEKKMSAKWYAALTPLLAAPGPLPTGTYLSTLTPTLSNNGWGPFEKDKSNGEANAGDGNVLTLNGTTYSKGLGVHAGSELRYTLNGQYSSFQSDIGVDDEVGNNGSVVFQVFDGSGTKLYDSGTMLGATATKSTTVDVTGKSELRLVVTNNGDSSDFDHADWANARLNASTGTTAAPVVNTFAGGSINEGGTYTATGSFTDAGAGPWTATVNYGDGAGSQALTLTNKTFALNHAYVDNGNYSAVVTVVSATSTASGSNSAAVVVKNVAPILTMPPDFKATVGTPFSVVGSFKDPGANDTFTALVNYGDGSASQALTLSNKTFVLSRTYASVGTYSISVTITDKDGGTTTGTISVYAASNTGGTQATTYLSDLSPTFSSNGWGPVEKDQSNGEANAGDGAMLKINGAAYTKGLGVHAPSELRYALGKAYSRFKASIGVDDETGGNGSVQFLVYGDGVLLYDSGVVRGKQTAKAVDVDVTNVGELKLIVHNAGDGNNFDHADWANAAVYKASAFVVNAITATTVDEGSTYVASGSFADPGTGPWTATVNYGDGLATQSLPLNSDKTFSLSHLYANDGAYVATVVLNNGTTTASTTTSVKVNNVAPAIAAQSDAALPANTTAFSRSIAFTDPGTDTFSATVDYGDGTGAHAVAMSADPFLRRFLIGRTYTYNGTYAVKIILTDNDGGIGTANFNVTVTGGLSATQKYLSDLTPTSMTNGWGAYERDMSNGEQASGDGQIMSVGGVKYARGLGVHASSDLTYSIPTGGNYAHFLANIGVDDEQGGNGSVDFKVYLDGTQVYDSGTVRTGAAKAIDLSVLGKSTIRLVVTDAGDGNTSDHADWAAARFTT